MTRTHFKAVVVGASAGGFKALEEILSSLPADYSLPLIIVQHMDAQSSGTAELLDSKCALRVKEAEDKEDLRPGTAYLAPANYHLLIEDNGNLALSFDEKENYSRPSIDVLFESAADAFGGDLVCVVLTGASNDGAQGAAKILGERGLVLIQDPRTAEFPIMPKAALEKTRVQQAYSLQQIAEILRDVSLGDAEKAS